MLCTIYKFLFFFSHCPRAHRDLHSFPTRRSSDLYLRRQRKNDARLTPCRRSKSGTGMPASASFRIPTIWRSEEHTSELQSRGHLVCRLLLEKKKAERGLPSCSSPGATLSRSRRIN